MNSTARPLTRSAGLRAPSGPAPSPQLALPPRGAALCRFKEPKKSDEFRDGEDGDDSKQKRDSLLERLHKQASERERCSRGRLRWARCVTSGAPPGLLAGRGQARAGRAGGEDQVRPAGAHACLRSCADDAHAPRPRLPHLSPAFTRVFCTSTASPCSVCAATSLRTRDAQPPPAGTPPRVAPSAPPRVAPSRPKPAAPAVVGGFRVRPTVSPNAGSVAVSAPQQRALLPVVALRLQTSPLVPAFTRRREVFAGRFAMFGFTAACFWEVRGAIDAVTHAPTLPPFLCSLSQRRLSLRSCPRRARAQWFFPSHPNIMQQVRFLPPPARRPSSGCCCRPAARAVQLAVDCRAAVAPLRCRPSPSGRACR